MFIIRPLIPVLTRVARRCAARVLHRERREHHDGEHFFADSFTSRESYILLRTAEGEGSAAA